jgi:ATP-citrate lyase beta-subunit
MAQRGIREFASKSMLASHLPRYLTDVKYQGKVALVTQGTDWNALVKENPWLANEKLVAKPDQLFGKRGKHGLLLIDADLSKVRSWVGERMGMEMEISGVKGRLTHFLIEPFTPHKQDEEYYFSMQTRREGDLILFNMKGGIDIESHWDEMTKIAVPILETIDKVNVEAALPAALGDRRPKVAAYIKGAYKYRSEEHTSELQSR